MYMGEKGRGGGLLGNIPTTRVMSVLFCNKVKVANFLPLEC